MLAVAGCATYSVPPRCGPGTALSEGACVPTPSLVFSRCVDTFRKTRIERQAGQETRVSASVRGHGSGSFEHGRTDDRAEEYAGLPEQLLPQAIAECRRQEEQERADRVVEAWAAADRAQREAKEAAGRAAAAERERARVHAEREALAEELDRVRAQLEASGADADPTALTMSLPPPPTLTSELDAADELDAPHPVDEPDEADPVDEPDLRDEGEDPDADATAPPRP